MHYRSPLALKALHLFQPTWSILEAPLVVHFVQHCGHLANSEALLGYEGNIIFRLGSPASQSFWISASASVTKVFCLLPTSHLALLVLLWRLLSHSSTRPGRGSLCGSKDISFCSPYCPKVCWNFATESGKTSRTRAYTCWTRLDRWWFPPNRFHTVQPSPSYLPLFLWISPQSDSNPLQQPTLSATMRHSSLCLFQSSFWQCAPQYKTILHFEHLLVGRITSNEL